MSKPLWFGLAATLLICSGCFLPPRESPSLSNAAAVPKEMKQPPPVKADQVTSTNVDQILEAMNAELDWEAQKAMLEPSPR